MTQQTHDEVKPTETPAATETPAVAEAEKPITRSELAALIADGIAAAMKKPGEPAAASTEAEVTRSDDNKGDEAGGKLLASVDSIAKSIEGLAASMDAMTKRMDSMEGATVVRSDSSDAAASTPTKRKDVFAGVFGRRTQND